MRKERDSLGEREIPDGAWFGIHTQRARENFGLSGGVVKQEWVLAVVLVKKACALA